jgi:hypothetical protein
MHMHFPEAPFNLAAQFHPPLAFLDGARYEYLMVNTTNI